MVVANHNPAHLTLESIELKVPNKNFRAQKFENQEWVDAVSSVICNDQQQEAYPKKTVTNCNMYIEQETKAHEISFTQVIFDATVVDMCTSDSNIIESDEISLEFMSLVDGNAIFTMTDKLTGETNPVGFGLRFW